MSKPLTKEQLAAIESAALDSFQYEDDAIRAALARLEYLERKLAAAEVLCTAAYEEARDDEVELTRALLRAITAYYDVQP